MGQYLTFVLSAPIASFGSSAAVGILRPGWDRPARSALLGIVAACLGVPRTDREGQAELATGYATGVLSYAAGEPLTDYHTVQTPSTRVGISYATRREELAAAENTVLSWRDYRVGAWHLGAVWMRDEAARWSLEDIGEAMRRPKFLPFIGRKCCPLGLPLAPRIDEAADAYAVLIERHRTGVEGQFRRFLAGAGQQVTVTLDADDPAVSGSDRTHGHTEIRNDQPISRQPWLFAPRREAIVQEIPT